MAFAIVEMLRSTPNIRLFTVPGFNLLRKKPFTCLMCMCGWCALFLSLMAGYGWYSLLMMCAGLTIGALFGAIQMRFL